MDNEHPVTIRAITEDSSKHSPQTMYHLIRRIVMLVDSSVNLDKVRLVPALKPNEGASAARGTNWRRRNKCRDDHNRLIRTIATSLARPNHFVFFHIDGDCEWGQRSRASVITDFDVHVRAPVANLLRKPGEDVDEKLERLFLVLPFYSIESWLYQNTKHAILICDRKYQGMDVDQFMAWGADRGQLDEIKKIKEAVELGNRHNHELAEHGFPARAVYEVGKSFADVVDNLKRSRPFTDALATARYSYC